MSMTWTLNDLDFAAVPVAQGLAEERLVGMVAAASLVESASDVYTANLVRYFAFDPDVTRWLREDWEPEELQHGQALRFWVEHAWPGFDWEATFSRFLDEYRLLCRIDALKPTPALEMVARCVIETGTATLYRTLMGLAHEPVLRDIAQRINDDEVRHFKYFYRFFRRYQSVEQLSRWSIAQALFDRLAELKREDADCAMRHVLRQRAPALGGDRRQCDAWIMAASREFQNACSYNQAARMLLTPLALPTRVRHWIGVPLAVGARLVMQGAPWRRTAGDNDLSDCKPPLN